MGIYIKGEPSEGVYKLTYQDTTDMGRVAVLEGDGIAFIGQIVEPHGRLIDTNVLCESLMTEWHTADENGKKIISEVMADVVTPIVVGTPTVIEAEGSE